MVPWWPTLCVGGTADDVGDLGFETGGGGVVLVDGLIATRTQGDNTLHWGVGPQQLTLMDGQRCGVVDEETTILETHRDNQTSEKYHKDFRRTDMML
jgi:hypothetical protein